MPTALFPRLLGDVGGTNARFAWQSRVGAPPSHIANLLCQDHDSLLAAIRHYLHQHGLEAPQACAIGIANPVTGDWVQMTNHHWSFSIQALHAQLGVQRLQLINDFSAIALSLPELPAQDLHLIGPADCAAAPNQPMAVLGAGTGLGVSCLLPTTGQAITGEGGHCTLGACTSDEAELLRLLAQRFGHVSAERVLSGPGLVNLYQACATRYGLMAQPLAPADVVHRALTGANPLCLEALDHFCAFLGNFAGNMALTYGARGGVYLAGGIAPRIIDTLRQSSFRARFEEKGRLKPYLSPIPTWVIASTHSPAFLGLSQLLDQPG
ncbi:glucokinase [Roseateles sp. BYS180W]|uniref:Glucokinase n=1 Tax=Roseateles rivi TaxID=3299028 RepID=A0ABW7FSY4_9BURK